MEEVVENLVKTWEFEASHKLDMEQWTTVSSPSEYCVTANGGAVIQGKDAKEMGNYNALMAECPAYQLSTYYIRIHSCKQYKIHTT